MKGVTLISDIFLLIALLALTVIMVLFINVLIITFQIESKLLPGGIPTTRNVELKLFFKPINYDALMSAFLEYEYQGIKVKKILNAVAIQGKTTVWLDGKNIDATAMSEGFLSQETKNDYLLKIGDLVVASQGSFSSDITPLGIHKISTYLFSLDGKEIYLQFFVVD